MHVWTYQQLVWGDRTNEDATNNKQLNLFTQFLRCNPHQWCFNQQQFMHRERTNHRYKIMIRSGTHNVHVQEHIYCLDAICFSFYTWFTLGIVFVGHVTPVDSVGYVGVMSDCHRCVAEPLTKHQIANSIPWSLHSIPVGFRPPFSLWVNHRHVGIRHESRPISVHPEPVVWPWQEPDENAKPVLEAGKTMGNLKRNSPKGHPPTGSAGPP